MKPAGVKTFDGGKTCGLSLPFIIFTLWYLFYSAQLFNITKENKTDTLADRPE